MTHNPTTNSKYLSISPTGFLHKQNINTLVFNLFFFIEPDDKGLYNIICKTCNSVVSHGCCQHCLAIMNTTEANHACPQQRKGSQSSCPLHTDWGRHLGGLEILPARPPHLSVTHFLSLYIRERGQSSSNWLPPISAPWGSQTVCSIPGQKTGLP